MNKKLYHKLWNDAMAQPDKELYVAEYGYPDWFDEIGETPEEIISFLGELHDIIWRPFGEYIRESGMTQKEFSEYFCIPKRNIEQWSTGKHYPPAWVRRLIIEKLRDGE